MKLFIIQEWNVALHTGMVRSSVAKIGVSPSLLTLGGGCGRTKERYRDI